jgi:hypothetical protein
MQCICIHIISDELGLFLTRVFWGYLPLHERSIRRISHRTGNMTGRRSILFPNAFPHHNFHGGADAAAPDSVDIPLRIKRHCFASKVSSGSDAPWKIQLFMRIVTCPTQYRENALFPTERRLLTINHLF